MGMQGLIIVVRIRQLLKTVVVLTLSALGSSLIVENAQATSISAKARSTCILDDNCVFQIDDESPKVVFGEEVSFGACLAKRDVLTLEFQSSWPGKSYATWIKIAKSVPRLDLVACSSQRPYKHYFRFTVSKKNTNIGRVEYRVKIGKAAPLGKWTGIGYSTIDDALLIKIPPVILPVSLSSQVVDLQGFIDQYAQSVVTVLCGGVQGSGVSIGFSADSDDKAKGYQSMIITNEHVIFDCMKVTKIGEDIIVTVLYKGVKYVGYVTISPSWNSVQAGTNPDLAAIMTTALIPPSSYRNVAQPKLGHSVVAVGTAGGVPNVTTRGDIAGVTSTKIVTTAPAGHGSSGGALFNTRGQLLGFITAANATLVEVLPISELCKFLFACTTPITFVP